MLLKIIFSILVNFSSQSCIEGCLKCGEGGECQICDISSSYIKNLLTKECNWINIPNCKIISSKGNCLICERNYFPSNETCIEVDTENINKNQFCEEWNTLQSCQLCQENYFIENQKCIAVLQKISNCKFYLNQGKCQKCHNGYLLIQDNTICEPLPKIDNCMSVGDYLCLECKENQVLNPNLHLLNW